MNAPERLLIRDYLFRKRYYYLGGLALHLGLMTACWWSRPANLIGILFCSALLLGFDLTRGGTGLARTLLSMPVTAGQLARCWRFTLFTLPAVAGLAVLGISAVIGTWFRAPLLNLGGFLIIALAQTVSLGLMLFMLTGLPSQVGPGDSPGRRIANFCFGMMWGLSYPAVIFLSQDIPRKWAEVGTSHIIVGLLLGAATVAGCLRVDELVLKRMVRAASGTPRRVKTTIRTAAWSGFGALPYLLLRSGIFLLAMVLMMLVFNWVFLSLLRAAPGTKPTSVSINFFIPFISMFAAQYLLSQLRVMRTMPLGRGMITHVLVLWPLALSAASLVTGTAINQVLFGTSPAAQGNWIVPLATAVLTGLMLPLFLRFGMRYWMILAVIFPVMFLSSLLGAPFIQLQDFWIFSGALVLAMFVLAIEWVACYRLLGSPYPWRAGALIWPGQQRRLG